MLAINENIGYRQWRPLSPRAVCLLVHGIGAHSGRWEAMADFLLLNGIASYAIDLKDFDKHGVPDKGSTTFRDYYDKIMRLYDIASKENTSKKIFLVGESLGALISFLLVAGRPNPFNGLVCLSPAFANRYKPAIADRLKMFKCLFYDKEKRFKMPFDSSMCTRDADYRRRLDEDPREYRSIPAREIFDILSAQIRARFTRNRIGMPVFFLVAGDDKIVDSDTTRKVFDRLIAEDKTLMKFPGMHHSLSIELDKENIFKEILKWVEKRI